MKDLGFSLYVINVYGSFDKRWSSGMVFLLKIVKGERVAI
jgi:hypothetical protein